MSSPGPDPTVRATRAPSARDAIAELTRLTLARRPLVDVFEAIVRSAAGVTGCTTAAIAVLRPAGDAYEVVAVHGPPSARAGHVSPVAGWQSLLDPRFQRRGVRRIPAGALAAQASEAVLGPRSRRSPRQVGEVLLAAVRGSDARLAAIVVLAGPDRDRAIGDAALRRLAAIADHAALAIDAVRQTQALQALTAREAREASGRRRHEDALTYMAYHDALTELPNRIMAEEQIELALARARRSRGSVALLFVDLDGFKEVNDTLGHAAGDHLLAEVATRLRAVLRDSDMLARHGGDEFLVLAADLPADAVVAVENVAGKLLDSLRQPFDIAGRTLRSGASIGVGLYPADADDTESLLRIADEAMYGAKTAGGGRMAFHRGTESILSRRASLSAQLMTAMRESQLELHYQPVWSLRTPRTIRGVEALLRWQHPQHGLLRPDAFINTAEQSVAGDELVSWVIADACRQAQRWAQHDLRPVIGLNVSQQQLVTPGYVDLLVRTIGDAGLDPHRFMIELTESAWTVGADETASAIAHLRDHRVRAALDDFGAGYTTLSRIRQLPCDVIKVDRALLASVPGDPGATALAAAAFELAGSARVRVVAEGVETEEQVTLLRSLGVVEAQGFLFGHPLVGDRLTTLLSRHRPGPGTVDVDPASEITARAAARR